jgi:ADP-L-glycero-D-manno-heptose 6-epimerase
MDQNKIILLTGAAGFIGSYMTGFLNAQGYEDLILVDEFDDGEKELNLHTKKYRVRVERDDLFTWLEKENPAVDFVFHLGARTDTTEFDYSVLEKLNVEFSKQIWKYCTDKNTPLIYASSAATYGSGESGYKDDHDIVEKLKPLNPYGISKNEFDKWMLKQTPDFPFWAGLKFFNVYGPNEYHKGRMASMVFHGFNQIQSTGKVRLFKSHKPEYKDGEQLRDFIYVEDVCRVMFWMMKRAGSLEPAYRTGRSGVRSLESGEGSLKSGLYNLGTGKARTFIDLVTPIFTSLGLPVNIEFIDIPEDIRDKYQYFTEADMGKLRKAGFTDAFYSVEEGVSEYVKNYLLPKKFY